MRHDLLGAGADELHYEIRGIVPIAERFQSMGIPITWENIGDPVSKGEKIPLWIKEIIKNILDDDKAYAYCPTRGLLHTREFVADMTNKRGKAQITPNDIIFFNGLGDAISKIYQLLSPSVRVIGPSPAYSTHSSAEAEHASSKPINYPLDPRNNWYPNINELRNSLKYNPSISGILVINPNNPTGAVYTREHLESIVQLAEEFDQFLVFDEIYMNITLNGNPAIPLSDIIGGVCGISLKGISKEWPWPGARCGWLEAYNIDADEFFSRYVDKIHSKKMLEVCSTTLPQMAIPLVLSDPRYEEHQMKRNMEFKRRAEKAHELLQGPKGIIAHKTEGAFYMTVMFEDGVLNEHQRLYIENGQADRYLNDIVQNASLDTRFVYNLLAATGICVVPLTSFDCRHNGFRVTLLETDREKFEWTFRTIREKINEYIGP